MTKSIQIYKNVDKKVSILEDKFDLNLRENIDIKLSMLKQDSIHTIRKLITKSIQNTV